MTTQVPVFIGDLDGGVFEEKLANALSAVAMGVVSQGKAGEVAVTFKVSRIGESSQVQIKHKLKFTVPRKRGQSIEDDTTETPMHVNRAGEMTLFPDTQTEMPFTKPNQELV